MRRIYPVKMPSIIQKFYSDYTWRFNNSEKVIYLTFDDGPIPGITEWVLDELNKYNAKATFFCIGDNVVKHPNIYKKVLEQGHSVGNHTQHHLKGWETSLEDYIQDFEEGNSNINTKLFRPPFGKITNKQAKAILSKGYKIVMWEILSGDFDEGITKEKCLANVINKTKSGSIVVFHDSIRFEEKMKFALSGTLAHFSKKGYSFKAIEL